MWSPGWPELAVALLTVLAGVIEFARRFKRRVDRNLTAAETEKVEAEAEQIRSGTSTAVARQALDQVEAYGRQLTQVWARLAEQDRHIAEQDRQIEMHAARDRVRDELAMDHAAWDHVAIHHLRECGVELEPPPPLRPPSHRRED